MKVNKTEINNSYIYIYTEINKSYILMYIYLVHISWFCLQSSKGNVVKEKVTFKLKPGQKGRILYVALKWRDLHGSECYRAEGG